MATITIPNLIYPEVGGDNDIWGNILNENLSKQVILYNSIKTNIETLSTATTTLASDKLNVSDVDSLIYPKVDAYLVSTIEPNIDVYIDNYVATTTKADLDSYVTDTLEVELKNYSDTLKEEITTTGNTVKESLDISITEGTTLKEDLNTKNTIATELIENLQAIIDSYSASKDYFFDEQRFLKLPSDFTPELPCNFYRECNGDIQHEMDFTQYTGGTEIFVDLDSGSDITGDGSESLPYRTLSKACTVASDGIEVSYCIKVLSNTEFLRDEGICKYTDSFSLVGKQVSIIPNNSSNKIITSMGQSSLSWISEDNVWVTNRSNVFSVYDRATLDENNFYSIVNSVISIEECKNKENSWFTDGVYVYINTGNIESAPSDDRYIVNVNSGRPNIFLDSNSSLYIENMHIYTGANHGAMEVTGDSSIGSKLVMNGCYISGGDLRDESQLEGTNALNISNITHTYLFNCKVSYSSYDGFNYHFGGIDIADRRKVFVLEYNCEAYNWSYHSNKFSNNGTTIHEGVNILRIGTKANGGDSPLADVDGCYSICIDCDIRGGTTERGNYYFGYEGDNGKAFVVNCKSELTVGLCTYVPTYVYNFDGYVLDTGYQNILAK